MPSIALEDEGQLRTILADASVRGRSGVLKWQKVGAESQQLLLEGFRRFLMTEMLTRYRTIANSGYRETDLAVTITIYLLTYATETLARAVASSALESPPIEPTSKITMSPV